MVRSHALYGEPSANAILGTTASGAAASGAPEQVTTSGSAGVQDMLQSMSYVLGSTVLGAMFLLL